jgi:hypothetical protein
MVEISRDLAENLLDDVNELLGSISDLRKYKRYNRSCVIYEAEISELKAALLKEESAKTAHNRQGTPCPACDRGGIILM